MFFFYVVFVFNVHLFLICYFILFAVFAVIYFFILFLFLFK